MNTQPKNKILIIIIGILLIANVVTLSVLIFNKNVHTKSGRQDRQAQITTFLKKNVGFTQDQLGRYDTISSENRSKMKVVFDEIAVGREDIFRKLASQEYSDSAIVIAANAIAEQQKAFEIKMLFHLKDIRNICTPVQQAVFDTGFYKIISKRSDGRNNKKNK